jgi:hypothetical protein
MYLHVQKRDISYELQPFKINKTTNFYQFQEKDFGDFEKK